MGPLGIKSGSPCGCIPIMKGFGPKGCSGGIRLRSWRYSCHMRWARSCDMIQLIFNVPPSRSATRAALANFSPCVLCGPLSLRFVRRPIEIRGALDLKRPASWFFVTMLLLNICIAFRTSNAISSSVLPTISDMTPTSAACFGNLVVADTTPESGSATNRSVEDSSL